MPGTNLTRDEARERADLLAVESYDVELDLTAGATSFGSTTTLTFDCRRPGASSFADLVEASIEQITLNGQDLDPAEAYTESRIQLPDLQEHNTLVVRATCPYSHSGEGLHRFVDPADDRVYTYTQFEVPDARRVYTTFEQPDLKGTFRFTVTAPEGWVVSSNAPAPTPEPAGEGRQVWRFEPTLPLSTYVTAVVAGEYHRVEHVYHGAHGDIPLGHYCRQSLVDHLDVDELVTITEQGFEFFEKAFDYRYPFGKYDQLYVPEYNMGAMENAGCVTLRDEYLPRSRQDRSFYEFRASVILHEMAHMWFGDLVTMRWWDDLWLNESFAEWACYHAAVAATEYDASWTGFTNARKNWAYRQDQLPSTHPIAADNHDLRAVEVNFDGITYAKGASVLKQLVAFVGLEPFLSGLGAYFRTHEFGNSEFVDLMAALERSSGRDLHEWAAEWLQTAGVNTLRPAFEVDDQGRFTSFAIEQAAPEEHPTLRRHHLGVGAYDAKGGRLVRRTSWEVEIEGPSTPVEELVGEQQPDLLLLNEGDLAYAKIRLDERSLATATSGLSRLDDSLARALCWGAAWDMTRDAEMPARQFIDLVSQNIGAETDAFGSARLPGYAAQALHNFVDPSHRQERWAEWEQTLLRLLEEAEPGSDHQLTYVRALAAAAHTDPVLDRLEGILAGENVPSGLAVDTDLTWALLIGLARAGRAGEDRIEEALAADRTISGRERAAAAKAARPTAEAKAAAWEQAMISTEVPNETARSIAHAFHQPGQQDVLAPYVERYLEAALTAWERLGTHRASVALEALFPRVLASPELLQRVEEWLDGEGRAVDPATRRLVLEGADDVRRYLRGQQLDARS